MICLLLSTHSLVPVKQLHKWPWSLSRQPTFLIFPLFCFLRVQMNFLVTTPARIFRGAKEKLNSFDVLRNFHIFLLLLYKGILKSLSD